MISNHLAALEKFLHLHSWKTKKVLILGDFNTGVNKQYMQSFCETYDLKSLQKQPNCYKNPNSPTCIDLFWRMLHVTFKVLVLWKQGCQMFIWRFWLSLMRKSFTNVRPRIINYGCFKHFSNEALKRNFNE